MDQFDVEKIIKKRVRNQKVTQKYILFLHKKCARVF